MKANVHPTYHTDTVITCACGNSFTTGSTKPKIHVDICSACHPFFTGEVRYVDTAGRVDKFMNKMQTASQTTYVKKKDKRQARLDAQKAALAAAPQSMKEMITEARKAPKAPAVASSSSNASDDTNAQQ